MKLRDIRATQGANSGTRSLFESALVPEVAQALRDWATATKGANAVLIGGMAYSYYAKPRYTQDADFLFLSAADVPDEVPGFKRTRPGAFEHRRTGVEIEVPTAASINMTPEMAQAIATTAETHDGLQVASRAGLIAAKLKRFSRRDQADIEDLLAVGPVDLSPFPLAAEELEKFKQF